ncbi:MAG: L,D-transpeptidase family protein [Clostridia bacterium]|nr:L,D-transpeptidase family protein [Clostridia bacterium]
MRSKKVYIGVLATVLFFIICVCASIFYIKSNNKDVEIAEFVKNFTNENTKQAMETTEEVKGKSKAVEMKTNAQNKSKEQDNEKVVVNLDENEVKKEIIEEVKEVVITEPVQNTVEENKKENNTKSTQQSTISETKKAEKKEEIVVPKKEIVVTPLEKTLYVNIDSLNVRSGPDTTYSRIGGLNKADKVKITGQAGDWYRISYNNKVGYVKASYLVVTKLVIEEPKVEVSNVAQTNVSNSEGTVLNNLIIINSRNNTLRYYCGGKLTRSYSCATGASSSPTPQGKFKVYNKIVNRPYYKLNIPGGAPNNPLGNRWLGLDVDGTKGTTYAIHGTNNESSIGGNVSQGCIRMHNADIQALYEIVPKGTTVIIKSTNQSDKQIAANYGINIE